MPSPSSCWSRARLGIAALLLCAAAAWPRAARADAASAKPFYDRGIVEYNLGHFAEAIVQFEKAYEQDRAPILLFNIAQAHRQSGNPERALFFYRRYLEGDPSAANRPDVEKRMAELDEVVKRQAENKTRPPTEVAGPGQPTPSAPSAAPATPGAPQASPGAPTAATTATVTPRSSGDPGSTLKIAGIVTASVGAAALIGGVVFSAKVASGSDDVTNAPVFDPNAESSAKSAETMQWVCYGVGAAAAATGAVLFYLGHQKSQTTESRVSLVPVMGPGQPAGAALWMTF